LEANLFFGRISASGIRLRCGLYLPRLAALAVLALLPIFWPASAQAQTWLASPGSGDWNTTTNWNPATVPNLATADVIFGTSNRSAVSLSGGVAVGSITFNGSTAYTLDLNGQLMTVSTAGFSNTSGLTQNVIVNGLLDFKNSATAGGSDIAYSVQGGGSTAQFQNNSTLGAATFTVNSGATLQMIDSSTGGTAAVINNGTLLMEKSDGVLSIGSLAGSGNVVFATQNGGAAAQTLTVGTLNSSTIFSGQINDGIGVTGALSKVGTGTLTLTGTNGYTGATTIAAGTLALTGTGSIAASSQVNLTNTGATFDISGTTTGASVVSLKGVSGSNVNLGTQTLTVTNGNALDIYYGAIGGSGGLTATGGFAMLGGTNTYTGVTNITTTGELALSGTASIASSSKLINNGTLDLSVMSVDASIKSLAGTNSNANLLLGNQSLILTAANDTYAGMISGNGGLTLTGGTETLTGAIGYSGATTINGGTLVVNSSLASSSGTTVNAGGTLMGTGALGNTSIAGGTFAPGSGTPGSSLTVNGLLGFTAASTYAVNINPTTSSFANVTGAATLGGATVNAIYTSGSYVAKQYTILTAGSRIGAFGSVVNSNLPTNFTTNLSYDAKNAYLNLALNFNPSGPTSSGPTSSGSTPSGAAASGFGSGLNVNQQNVGNTLINFFNTTGGIPLVFGALTPAGLSQASGETATGTQQTTFNAMTQFMGVMTDPFIDGRGNGGAPQGSGASGYASTPDTGAARGAFAMFNKAPVASFEQRWSTWVAGFGGSQTTDGNTAVGSNSATSRVYGTAVGADYRFSPDTIAGFSLAGGGTNFSVANAGTGHSDLFQAGAFVRHTIGAAYLSAALAYGWQDVTTDRTVTISGADQLRARFDANAWSGRLEGGYRFVTPVMGITPYAAGQFTTFDLPSYAEGVVSGASTFALSYGAKSVTDARSELGIRTDKSWALQDSVLTLRGRVAWAHDYDPDRSIATTFQTLPGASFVVNGAAQASDSALTTASAEIKWMNGWSAAATFEGEFSDVTRSYAGKGVVRYAW
jgi:autotransporter-associated beta strand protein